MGRWSIRCFAVALVIAIYLVVAFHLVSEPEKCSRKITKSAGVLGESTTTPQNTPTGRPLGLPPIDEAAGAARGSSSSKHKFQVDELSVEELLDPSLLPNTVFYVWCSNRWFEFHNYLSVLSVVRHIRPDNIIFFHQMLPVSDRWHYNTWFNELVQTLPFFRLQALQNNSNACSAYATPNISFIHGQLTRFGGIYVNEHTIISDFRLEWRKRDVFDAMETELGRGFMMSRAGFPGSRNSKFRVKCSNPRLYIPGDACVTADKVFYPKDIWELDSSWGRLARLIFYGNEEIQFPQSDHSSLIPNIAHIVWLGGGQMDYLFYMCVLSLLYVAKVDKIYIHGDAPPSGILWKNVSNDKRIVLIYRERPMSVYGTKVEVISHITDVWRVDFMLKYGGIYVDTDTIFVRPLDHDIRAFDAVGAYDWVDWQPPFPDTVNFGVAIGKKNATFWHQFQESMRWFLDDDWSWNGLRQPYKIKERQPSLLKIEPRLQVICYEFKCHPTWWPNYHNESIHHLNSKSLPDWPNDAYAYHFTLPTPPEFLSERNILTAKSAFGEMGRMILKKAGRL